MKELDPGTPAFEAFQNNIRKRLTRYMGHACHHCAGRKVSLTAVARSLKPPVDKSGLWRFMQGGRIVWPTLTQLDEYLRSRNF